MSTPFTDQQQIRGALYAAPERLGQRTGALHRAKIAGEDAATTIADLAHETVPTALVILDIGCGRGTSARRLAKRFPAALILALDQSPGLLGVAAQRLQEDGLAPRAAAGDFHHLPIATGSADLAVAGFCLYHSPQPIDAVIELARCLRPGGLLLTTTKSADSYRTIDEAIASTGLDPDACGRPSLYEAFHTANASEILAAAGLAVRRRVDQEHTFQFADAGHLAEYAATIPKYRLPAHLTGNHAALADALQRVTPAGGLTASSTVTYLLATHG